METNLLPRVVCRDQQHEQDFIRCFTKMKNKDCYHLAVAYLLALDETVSCHVKDVFDFEADEIKPKGLNQEWQTSTSRKTTRLIFNLWNGYCGDDAASYAVDQIFDSSLGPFYWEAVRLRFEFKYFPDFLDEVYEAQG